MAMQPKISYQEDTIVTIADSNGEPILEMGGHEYTVKPSSGPRLKRYISETIQLEDNTVWSPSMINKVPVGVCNQCRVKPPFGKGSHGLVTLNMAQLCEDGCGQLCCQKHVRLGQDGKWRCLKHHNRYLLKALLRPLFFKEEEDL